MLRNRFLRGNELVDVDDEVSAYVSGAVLDTGDLIGEQEPSVEDFPGGPVVKNLPSNEGSTGWIPGQKLIVHVPWVWQKKTKQKNCSNP